MKKSLKPGVEHEFRFRIPRSKTVAALYPESAEFQMMPDVLATGFMVGLIEWTCIQAVNPHIDWPREQTVGTHINVSHVAPTPPGLEVNVKAKLIEVDGRRLVFLVEAEDDIDLVSQGVHERFVIYPEKFNKKVAQKALRILEEK